MCTRGIAHPSRTGGRTAMRVLSLTMLLAALLAGAGFDDTRWKYFAPLRVLEPRRLCVLPFDRRLDSLLRPDFGDLRIEQAGEELPYVIAAMTGSVREREWHPAPIS